MRAPTIPHGGSSATVNDVDYVEPPTDSNDWTDEQWLTWLKSTDETAPDDTAGALAKVVQQIVQSSPGQVLGHAMLGMAQAMYGHRDVEVVIVAEGNGETTDDEPFAIRLDPEHPERSSVIFKRDSKSAP